MQMSFYINKWLYLLAENSKRLKSGQLQPAYSLPDKVVIPLQPFGVGDVIYQQTLVHSFMQQGYKILWPVEPHFVNALNHAYPDITFINKRFVRIDYNKKEDIEGKGVRIIPLRWADVILGLPGDDCMKAKYKLYNLDWTTWKQKAAWKRDKDRERRLYKELGLDNNEPYNLVNCTYTSNFSYTIELKINNGIRNIEMKPRKGYSLFDWAKVIENATEIHTVSTSLIYLFELLDLSQPIHLYPRSNDPHFAHIQYLFTKPYILH